MISQKRNKKFSDRNVVSLVTEGLYHVGVLGAFDSEKERRKTIKRLKEI